MPDPPSLTPPSYPIASAPRTGDTLLLWDQDYGTWVLGSWDGEAWYERSSGIVFAPVAWSPLPHPPITERAGRPIVINGRKRRRERSE